VKKSKLHFVSVMVLAVLSFTTFSPLLWMVLSSFKGASEIWRTPPTIFPEDFTISGYLHLFQKMPFGRYFFNSVLVSVSSTMIAVLTSSLAGYVFSKIRFKGRDALFLIVLSSMMIPAQATIVPNYILIQKLGLFDTYLALILPQGISVFGIFLVRQFMSSLPMDYLEAARIDGVKEWRIFLQIVFPLSMPAVSALAIFAFRNSWDSLLWPLVMTISNTMRTLPVGIAGLTAVHSPLMELILPASTITVVPILLVFFIFQKKFVAGITMSGLKG